MANSKAPKHDFAPAWLKIPSNDGPKSAGSKSSDHGEKSGRSRRDDYHGGFNRFATSDYMYGPLPRQRSFENYYDERRYSPQKFRHHSGDDDPFSPPYGYNYGYNGYNYEKYNNHYRSHPALGKYQQVQHPGSRYSQMNGGFPPHPPPPPPYYDPYFYDYYANDPYYNNNYMRGLNGNGGGGSSHKRYPSGDKDSKSQAKGDKDKDGKKINSDADCKKAENLDEEFPSLNGDAESSDSKTNQKPVTSGVWDGQSKDNSNRQQSSNIYKSLVPKNTMVRKTPKDGSKLIGNGKDLNSANHSGPNKLSSSANTSPYKLVNNKDTAKESSCPSPTGAIDMLNTRLVTTPKNLTDKKSDFLRTLREDKPSGSSKKSDLTAKDSPSEQHTDSIVEDESPLSNGNAAQLAEEPLTNGLHDLKLGRGLESLLEAEQRLLKEMGWNEMDGEEYEITEDEKREFEKRSKQLKEQRNGFKRTLLPSPWSPQHVPSYVPALQTEGDETASSLSEDSDLD